MAENKTKATDSSVDSFIDAIDDEIRRKDCHALAKLIAKVTKEKPRMWGSSIVGFGSYHSKYDSGREGDSCLIGFSARKGDISGDLTANFLDTTNSSRNSVSTRWERRVCIHGSSRMLT